MLGAGQMDAALRATGIGRRFGPRWAVARVDLEVAPSERLLIIGPNGCGKTTLLKLMSTLLPPSQGSITFPATGGPRRADIGLMGHDIGIYEDLSAPDNLRVFARLSGCDAAQIPGILETVGLGGRQEPVSRFSAGMRRRLALALCCRSAPSLHCWTSPSLRWTPAALPRSRPPLRRSPALSSSPAIRSPTRLRWPPEPSLWTKDRSAGEGVQIRRRPLGERCTVNGESCEDYP